PGVIFEFAPAQRHAVAVKDEILRTVVETQQIFIAIGQDGEIDVVGGAIIADGHVAYPFGGQPRGHGVGRLLRHCVAGAQKRQAKQNRNRARTHLFFFLPRMRDVSRMHPLFTGCAANRAILSLRGWQSRQKRYLLVTILTKSGAAETTKRRPPVTNHPDSFKCRRTLKVGSKNYTYFSLPQAEKNGLKGISKLPFSMKVLLENLLRHEDGHTVTKDDIKAVIGWLKTRTSDREIAFRPARVLMQDLTGVPAVVDLAAMRDAMKKLGGNPEKINPLAEVDLVIDHSVMVDNFGAKDSFKKNVAIEYERNAERYQFLRWGQQAFANFRVVPPGTGICHQVNLEYLAETVWVRKQKEGKKTVEVAFPDTVVGTDSHTTMINGLAVLGWGVGGIEAEAAMLGQPISMLIPEIIGFKLTGKLRAGVTATDLALTVTQMLR